MREGGSIADRGGDARGTVNLFRTSSPSLRLRRPIIRGRRRRPRPGVTRAIRKKPRLWTRPIGGRNANSPKNRRRIHPGSRGPLGPEYLHLHDMNRLIIIHHELPWIAGRFAMHLQSDLATIDRWSSAPRTPCPTRRRPTPRIVRPYAGTMGLEDIAPRGPARRRQGASPPLPARPVANLLPEVSRGPTLPDRTPNARIESLSTMATAECDPACRGPAGDGSPDPPETMEFLHGGEYEHSELTALRRHLTPDDVVMESGRASVSSPSRCTKPVGGEKVFSFEANPALEPLIRANYKSTACTRRSRSAC